MLGRQRDSPHPPVNLLGDFATGSMQCVMGILMALYERVTSNKGQVVDVAMTAGAGYLSAFLNSAKRLGLFERERGTNMLDGGAHFYDTYKTSDGLYMSVGSIEPKFYSQLLEGLGINEAELPSQMDTDSWPELKKLVAEKFATKTRAEWSKIFAGLDACVEPVLSMKEAAEHPQNVARDVYRVIADLPSPNPEPRLSRTPGTISEYSTYLPAGKHTVAILSELGYSEQDISELLKYEVVFQNEDKTSSKL